MKRSLLTVCTILMLPCPIFAGITYLESISGDLSSNNLSPTPITFTQGLNTVAGTMGGDPGDGIPLDRDFFSFTISPGLELTSIYVNFFSPPGASFYAIGPGTSIDITSPASHLSNRLVTGPGELLALLSASPYSGGTGLSNPVGPGTYTVWFQEVSSVVTYDFGYTVTPAVPETSRGLFLLGACAPLLLLRFRKCSFAHLAPSAMGDGQPVSPAPQNCSIFAENNVPRFA